MQNHSWSISTAIVFSEAFTLVIIRRAVLLKIMKRAFLLAHRSCIKTLELKFQREQYSNLCCILNNSLLFHFCYVKIK